MVLSTLFVSPVTALAGATHPSAPRDVAAVAGNNAAIVSFVAPSYIGGARVIEYYVAEYGRSSAIRRCYSTRCTVLGLSNGVGYRFVVAAINRFGRSAYSVPSNVVTPAALSSTTTTTTPTSTTTTTTTTLPGIPASDYGPQDETYQTYGNVYPADLGDCTFAGAANWEQIILGANPNPTVIGYEFAEAGGSAASGLSMTQFLSYWYEDGIAGYYLHGYDSYYTTQVNVENGILDYTALLAVLDFASGDYVGDQVVPAGSHVVVVDGYSPEGPLVVTWGMTIQMSWQQWNAEATAMYGINASSSPN